EIERLPRARRAPTLDKANAAIAKAEATAAKANQALERAKAKRDDAKRDGDDAARNLGEAKKQRTKIASAIASTTKELSSALGANAAAKQAWDPVAAVDVRLDKLGELESARDAADDATAEARESAIAAEREQDALRARVSELRARAES